MECPKLKLDLFANDRIRPCSDWCCLVPRLAQEARQGVLGLQKHLSRRLLEAAATGLCLWAMLVGYALEGHNAHLSLWAYGLAYLTGGAFGAVGGVKALLRRAVDVDLLMVLAALGAAYIGHPFEGAMLLFLFSLSNLLQSYALDRTRSAIRVLMRLRPEKVRLRRDGRFCELAVDAVQPGDLMVLRPGDRVPVDGIIQSGAGEFDQAALTGESMPVYRQAGDRVLAGSINQSASLEVQVTHRLADSTLARLIRMVEEARQAKARTQRFLERAEGYYAGAVLAGTALAIAVPLLWWGATFDATFYRAMALMVAASPCALVISTPATILAAIGNGARRGVLFKGGVHVEQAGAIKVVAFDKTGTLTAGKPRLVDIRPLAGQDADEVLALAAAVEAHSEHPLARAVVEAAGQRGVAIPACSDFGAVPGRGAGGRVGQRQIWVGALPSMGQGPEVEVGLEALRQEGKTPVVVAQIDAPMDAQMEAQTEVEDKQVHILGILAFADTPRPDAAAAVERLKELGIEKVVLLTGDHQRAGEAVAAATGIDEVHAGLLPQQKVEVLRQLQRRYGPVAMVGDGINDAPALAAADLGVAMGAAGTDAALETADVVLMGDDLHKLAYAIGLGRRARRVLVANLGVALGAMAVMVGAIMGWGMSLPLAVIGHEGGTVLVARNGLRLLRHR